MATLSKRGTTQATTGTTWASLTNAVDGVYGTNPSTYATMTSAVSAAVATIEIGGFDFSAATGGTLDADPIISLRHFENNAGRFASIVMRPYIGATPISTAGTVTLATSVTYFASTWIVSLAQLLDANFKIRVTITGASSTQSRIFSIDHIDITFNYIPPVPSITQAAYRWYADGTESGSTALAAQDTAP